MLKNRKHRAGHTINSKNEQMMHFKRWKLRNISIFYYICDMGTNNETKLVIYKAPNGETQLDVTVQSYATISKMPQHSASGPIRYCSNIFCKATPISA